jgi:hypothetical protein
MITPDLVSQDRSTSRFLVVEVEQSIADIDRPFLMQQLRSYAKSQGTPNTVYYVLVDNDSMRFYKEDEPEPRLLHQFPTREILQPYIGDTYTGTMSAFLMSGMTMAWLRDLSIHWKEANPPKSGELDPAILDLLNTAGVRVEAVP